MFQEAKAAAVIEESNQNPIFTQYHLEWLQQEKVPETNDSYKYNYTSDNKKYGNLF